MNKRVVLVGHCGPDSAYLRSAIHRADPDAKISSADDEAALAAYLRDGVDLLLLNRVLDYGFPETSGIELIKRLQTARPAVRCMLVSNYPEAQAEAEASGALPGFGKREVGSARVAELLRQALASSTPAPIA